MSKGFVILVQNTADVDYLKQAYALALSIQISQSTVKNISLVTSDEVPEHYKQVFDQILPIPWVTEQSTSRYRAEHRWKLYYASPYDETIVLDADMLILEDIATWWDQCSNYDVNYCSRIKNYKLNVVTDSFYRKAFVNNNLPSPYSALHYFKKSEAASEFYKVLEFVCNNWEWCYGNFAPDEYENFLSMDLATAITIELTGMHSCLDVNSPLEFIHMRPLLQDWEIPFASWQDAVPCVLNSDGYLIVGNIRQSRIFHYIEKDFLTDAMVLKLEEVANGK